MCRFVKIQLCGFGTLKHRHFWFCCPFKSGTVWQKLKISFKVSCVEQISAVSFVLNVELLLIKTHDRDKYSCSSEHLREPLSNVS